MKIITLLCSKCQDFSLLEIEDVPSSLISGFSVESKTVKLIFILLFSVTSVNVWIVKVIKLNACTCNYAFNYNSQI